MKLFPRYHGPPLMEQIVSVSNLTEAWRRVRSNIQVARRGSSAGIDAVTIHDFAADWPNQMALLAEELRNGAYRPLPARRVTIPKARGGERVIAILTVRDRIAQRAVQQVLEPLFDPYLLECSYGCRLQVGVPHALAQVSRAADRGLVWVVDADIASYFDRIDHRLLLGMVRQRIDEVRVLQVLAQWLDAAVSDGLPGSELQMQPDGSHRHGGGDELPQQVADGWGMWHGSGLDTGSGGPLRRPLHAPHDRDAEFYAAAAWEGGARTGFWHPAQRGPAALLDERLWTVMGLAQPVWSGVQRALPYVQRFGGQRVALAAAVVATAAGAAVAGEAWLRQRQERRGTLQGGAISPLLANIYLHPFDLAITSQGWKLVRFMDDFVILCASRDEAEQALAFARRQLATLRLEVNEEKTQLVNYEDGLDFLGQTLVPPRRRSPLAAGMASFAEAEQVIRTTSERVRQRLRRTGRRQDQDHETEA
jgi:RNA-directed DNA polymerase